MSSEAAAAPEQAVGAVLEIKTEPMPDDAVKVQGGWARTDLTRAPSLLYQEVAVLYRHR
jgi:hypothetical protein